MGDSHLAGDRSAAERLSVADHAGAGSRISGMADGDVPASKRLQIIFVEHLRDEAHIFVDPNALSVSHRDPRALLSPVLKSEQSKERDPRHILSPAIYAKDSAFFLGRIG